MSDTLIVNQPRRLAPGDPPTMPIRVGTAPVNWNNDDLPNWRPILSAPLLLDQMAHAGYAGAEWGEGYPTEPTALSAALSERGLSLCGAYRWLHLAELEAFANELLELETMLDLLAAVDCPDIVVSNAMTPERIDMAGLAPEDGSAGLSALQWDVFVENLSRVGLLAGERGIHTHYHNHVGTHVETPAEVERLVQMLPHGVDLCFDTGHYAFGGGDPTRFVQDHADQIGYLHLKDVDAAMLSAVRVERLSFLDALRRFIFCELGQGLVDIRAIVTSLRTAGYSGWIIVEQDTCPGDPTETATRNRRYLREQCGL